MCGIFGIIKSEYSKFDYSTFCTLGIANDRRGGDSCGIFIDGVVEYGIGKERFFEDFFLQSELLSNIKKSKIAIGHCRKASVGAITLATAQPVLIQNENNETEFVVIHNGTIYNYAELAEKYIPEVNIKGLTDSQVMAKIFYHSGYNVLSEYIGGSVFVIVDYRNGEPKTLFFRGVSKRYDTDVQATEERPLYISINAKELVFSSIYTYLAALRPDSQVYTSPENTLCTFKDGKLYGIQKYDRSDCLQSKPIIVTNYSYASDAVYIDYLKFNPDTLIYQALAKRLHGHYWIGEYGGIYNGKPNWTASKDFWFFHGIPMANQKYFDFVWKYFLKSTKSSEQFTNDNECLIRYLSAHPYIVHNNLMYKIDNPDHLILVTGTFTPIGTTRKIVYKNGVRECEMYDSTHKSTICPVEDVNLKALKSLWKL